MSETGNSEELSKPNIMQKFGELPTGVQRVIIAVVLILTLVGLMLMRDMIKTEEMEREVEEFGANQS